VKRKRVNTILILVIPAIIIGFLIHLFYPPDNANRDLQDNVYSFSFKDSSISIFSGPGQVESLAEVSFSCENFGTGLKLRPFEFTEIDSYFSLIAYSDEPCLKISGFAGQSGFILDIRLLDSINEDSDIRLLVEKDGITENSLKLSREVHLSRNFISFSTLHSFLKKPSKDIHLRKEPQNTVQIYAGTDDPLVEYRKLLTNRSSCKSFSKYTDSILSFSSHIDWLSCRELSNPELVCYDFSNTGQQYLNPDIFKYYFGAISDKNYEEGQKMLRILENTKNNHELYIPLAAGIVKKYYDRLSNTDYLVDSWENLAILNRRWDNLLRPFIENEEIVWLDSPPSLNRKIFGLPAVFYMSLYVQDCNIMVELSETLGYTNYSNEFRNKALLYSVALNRWIDSAMDSGMNASFQDEVYNLMPQVAGIGDPVVMNEEKESYLYTMLDRIKDSSTIPGKSLTDQYFYIALKFLLESGAIPPVDFAGERMLISETVNHTLVEEEK